MNTPPAAVALRAVLALAVASCDGPPSEHAPAAPATRDLRYFLRRLRDPAQLPELGDGLTALASTWDRTGGNADGLDWKRVAGKTNVLLDVDGPGCIHRLYAGLVGEWVRGTRIQIFLDRAPRPLLDLPVDEFFAEPGGAFPSPLLARRSYPGSHFPIPYAGHARVQLASDEPEPRWGAYWQISYSSFPAGTPVRSLRLPLDADEQAELARVLGAWSLAESLPPPLPDGARVTRSEARLAAGGRLELALAGSGVIRELRASVAPRSALREVIVSLRWDGESLPAAELALGDLLGTGAYDPAPRFSSLLLGATEDEGYLRLPMPFARGARVALENRGGREVELAATLVHEELAELPAGWGRLRVRASRAPAATASSPRVGPLAIPAHPVLDERGRGKYVGVVLQVDWPYQGWWGEGDWLIWSDEEGWPPRYHGTGSEEYFNSGWTLFDRKAISGYVKVHPGPVAVYSFHLGDAFPFERNLRVAVETVGAFGGEQVIAERHPEWASAAFWYAAP